MSSGRDRHERSQQNGQPAKPLSSLSETHLRNIINTIPDLVWLKDKDGVFLACNRAFERFLGAEEDAIIGRTDYDFFEPELAVAFQNNDKRAMASGRPSSNEEWITIAETGARILVETIKTPMRDSAGTLVGVLGIARDITERKLTEQALESHLLALTKPLDEQSELLFEHLFNLEDIQRLQDQFSKATGVASLITNTDGYPITRPSNFCRLCMQVIRGTKKGQANCYASDAALGRCNPLGPTVQPCLSGGLWDAGAAITVGGRHIANWLIGQVRDESQSEDVIRSYAREIGTDEDLAVEAFREVPSMSRGQFEHVSQALFTMSKLLSDKAYQNVQQARFISDRKQAAEELLQLRNYLADVIDSMPSALVGVNASLKVVQWNSEAEARTGIPTQRAMGRALDEVLPQLGPMMPQVREAVNRRQAHTDTLEVLGEDGAVRYKEIIVYPLSGEHSEGAVIRIDDVTDRIRMEQTMVQTEKMMSVGGLAAGMAHEINNPLGGILQAVQNVERRLSPTITANLQAAAQADLDLGALDRYMELRGIPGMLQGIRKSGARAAAIVANMLNFSRQSQTSFTTCDVNALLDSTLEIASNDYNLKKRYDFRNIRISKEYDPAAAATCCIPNEMEQVFLNLFSNAAQAMNKAPAAGFVPRLTLRTRRQGAQTVIEIEDNGPGFDEAIRKRVFEPFFTTKPPGEGTGLGLSVSYFIIAQNHGGSIQVESSPGQGAKFIICLPQPECSGLP